MRVNPLIVILGLSTVIFYGAVSESQTTCSDLFSARMSYFDRNYAMQNGMDGRAHPAFITKVKLNTLFTIGGKTFPQAEIVDKFIDIRLKPNALATAIEFDKRNGGLRAQKLVETFLNFRAQFRTATIRSYSGWETDSHGLLKISANPSVRVEIQGDVSYLEQLPNRRGTNARSLRQTATIENDLLNILFTVDAVRPFEEPTYVDSPKFVTEVLSPVTFTKRQLTNELLHSMIGEAVVIKDKNGEIFAWLMAAKRFTSEGSDIVSFRILEPGHRESRVIEYDANQNDLKGIHISYHTDFMTDVDQKGRLIGTELELDPRTPVSESMMKLDLSKPVRVLSFANPMVASIEGIATLPTAEDRAVRKARGIPAPVIIMTAAGERIVINELSITKVFGTPAK